jgi:hypothetical protein
VTEAFPNPSARRKAQREVAEGHWFQQLSEERVEVSEKICALRPVEQQRGGWTDQEKKRLLQSDGRIDLEAVESAMRTALHSTGASAVSELMQYEPPAPDQRRVQRARQFLLVRSLAADGALCERK